jgi:hypothetical protein
MTKIVWNGCDNYVEADQAAQRGYDFDGENLFHGPHQFSVFEASEIKPEDIPKNDDGELNWSGIFGTETGKFYLEDK